jgi:hypothetical protein
MRKNSHYAVWRSGLGKPRRSSLSNEAQSEHFIKFATRVPGWCVVVGLIGRGQEINRGKSISHQG